MVWYTIPEDQRTYFHSMWDEKNWNPGCASGVEKESESSSHVWSMTASFCGFPVSNWTYWQISLQRKYDFCFRINLRAWTVFAFVSSWLENSLLDFWFISEVLRYSALPPIFTLDLEWGSQSTRYGLEISLYFIDFQIWVLFWLKTVVEFFDLWSNAF